MTSKRQVTINISQEQRKYSTNQQIGARFAKHIANLSA